MQESIEHTQWRSIGIRGWLVGIASNKICCFYIAWLPVCIAIVLHQTGQKEVETASRSVLVILKQHPGASNTFSFYFGAMENGRIYTFSIALHCQEYTLAITWILLFLELDISGLEFLKQRMGYLISVGWSKRGKVSVSTTGSSVSVGPQVSDCRHVRN